MVERLDKRGRPYLVITISPSRYSSFFVCWLMITSKNFVGLKPSVNISNTNQSVPMDWDPSVVLEFPKNMVDGKVHQMLVEWVLLHRNAELV
jgi:hypothetical protein